MKTKRVSTASNSSYKRVCLGCKGEPRLDDDYALIDEREGYGLDRIAEWECPHGHRWIEIFRVAEVIFDDDGDGFNI